MAAADLPPTVETVVLVEGPSDRLAVEAAARRMGVDLDRRAVAVIAMGGATNVGHFVRRFGPPGRDLRLVGLCDRTEEPHYRRTLPGTRTAPARIFVCDVDLEDELIRAAGVDSMLGFIESQDELGTFRIMQRQPAQRGRAIDRQLHRFVGVRSTRKTRYAQGLVERLAPERIPPPLAGLVAHVATG